MPRAARPNRKPGPRPVTGEARTERVYVRLTPEERERWEQAAAAEGRPLGQWIRWRLGRMLEG